MIVDIWALKDIAEIEFRDLVDMVAKHIDKEDFLITAYPTDRVKKEN